MSRDVRDTDLYQAKLHIVEKALAGNPTAQRAFASLVEDLVVARIDAVTAERAQDIARERRMAFLAGVEWMFREIGVPKAHEDIIESAAQMYVEYMGAIDERPTGV